VLGGRVTYLDVLTLGAIAREYTKMARHFRVECEMIATGLHALDRADERDHWEYNLDDRFKSTLSSVLMDLLDLHSFP
jgi:hypothetical protein